MTKNTSKKTFYFLFSVAILLTKFASMGDFAIYPVTNQFYELFPGKDSIVNYIISGPQLIITAMAFLVPLLATRLSKKKLIVLSVILFGIGSALSVVILNEYVIAFGRTLVGVGQGILAVVTITIIGDVFSDEEQQARYVGIYNAGGNAAAMLLSLGAGALAAYGWDRPFLLYLIAVPMLLAAIFFIPEQEPTRNDSKGQAKSGIGSFCTEFWVMAIAGAVFSMLRTIIMYYMSSFTAENSLGDSGVAALAASLAQLFAFVGAMSFSVVYSKIRRWIMPLACGIMAAALTLWCTTASEVTVFAVYCMACGSSGLFMAYIYAHAMTIVDNASANTAIGVLSAVCGIAAFVPTYFVTFLMKVLGADTVSAVLFVPMLIGLALFAVCLLYTIHLHTREGSKKI